MWLHILLLGVSCDDGSLREILLTIMIDITSQHSERSFRLLSGFDQVHQIKPIHKSTRDSGLRSNLGTSSSEGCFGVGVSRQK